MQNYLPYIYGQIEFLENNLNLLKKEIISLGKKNGSIKKIYGSLPKNDLSFSDYKKLRKGLSSSWENEWK